MSEQDERRSEQMLIRLRPSTKAYLEMIRAQTGATSSQIIDNLLSLLEQAQVPETLAAWLAAKLVSEMKGGRSEEE